MEKSSFFNSVNHDRRYKADDWARYFSSFIGNGVFPLPSTNLQVVEHSGMNIIVRPGKAWLNGYFYDNTSDLIIPLANADGVLKRIDRIVLRWDLLQRNIRTMVKSSVPAEQPVPPELQRDADAYEICLADVLVNNGVITVSQAYITDQRLDTSLCGIVAGVVQQIDTGAFNAQLQAWFRDYQQMSHAEYENLVEYFALLRQLADQINAAFQERIGNFEQNAINNFNDWFTTIRNILNDDAVGNLLNLIDSQASRIDLLEYAVFNDFEGYHFAIQFENLDGIQATGYWNQALKRIEC